MTKSNHSQKWAFIFFMVVLCLFLAKSDSSAQTTLITVHGDVIDEEGNPLPGASVLIRNIETGYTHSTITAADGYFIVTGIQAGKYECEVTLDGFTKQVRRGMTFNVGARVRLDFMLTPATLEEEVTVTAETPVVEVTKSEVSSVVTEKELDDLPILSRDFTQLSILKPGVQVASSEGFRSNALPRGTGEFLIDGVSNEELLENSSLTNIPADAIQEFRVLTNQFAAEYGNAGGAVLSAITKAGTNEFRGRLYGFYRDEAFDATNYFVEHESFEGPKRSQDEIDELKGDFTDYRYGGFLGGPFIKDKLHFFLSYEYYYYRTYLTVGGTTLIPERTTVPQERPMPQILFKLNYQPSEKHNFSGRFSFYKKVSENVLHSTLDHPDMGYQRDYRTTSLQFNWTFFPSDRTMNELKLHYALYKRYTGHDTDPNEPHLSYPSGNFGKYFNWPQTFREPRYQVVENFSIFLGNHSIKLGFDYSFIRCDIHAEIFHAGQYIFFSDAPHDPANPMTYPIVRIFNTGTKHWPTDSQNLGIFVQDAWRVNSRLTLNFGLRWNYFTMDHVEMDSGNLKNLNPRFGFSWDPVGDGKTVVRGGVGTFSLNNELNVIAFGMVSGGIAVEYWPGYPDPNVPNPFTVLMPSVFTNFVEPSTFYEYSTLVNPYTIQANLGIEREVIPDLSIAIDGVITRGRDFGRFSDTNPVIEGTLFVRPDMTRGPVYLAVSAGRTDYKALYFTAKKRFSNGWGMEISYTLSSSKADTEGPMATQNGYNADYWERRYGPTGTDARHRIVASGIVELPLGFQMSAIMNYRSALPWNAIKLTDANIDGVNNDYVDQQYNSRRGFDSFSINVRISNFIRVNRFVIQPFLEIYNLTNKANFGNVFNREGTPLFGIPTYAGNPRLIQLGLRLNF